VHDPPMLISLDLVLILPTQTLLWRILSLCCQQLLSLRRRAWDPRPQPFTGRYICSPVAVASPWLLSKKMGRCGCSIHPCLRNPSFRLMPLAHIPLHAVTTISRAIAMIGYIFMLIVRKRDVCLTFSHSKFLVESGPSLHQGLSHQKKGLL
jgi:hypothetical protein